jgi:hypothetical protein
MAHELLLVLMSVMSADELGFGQSLAEVGKAKPASSAQATAPSQVAPLVPGKALGAMPFQPFLLNQDPSGICSMDDRAGQLQNRRAGVTCSMRIIEVEPTFDRGIFAPDSTPHPDPIARNSLSPCVE